MEKVKTSECRPFHRRYKKPSAICFGVHAERNSDEVRQEQAERGSDWSGEPSLSNDCLSDNIIPSSYWTWRRASTTFT